MAKSVLDSGWCQAFTGPAGLDMLIQWMRGWDQRAESGSVSTGQPPVKRK
jgi:hypothetical protein